MEPEVFVAALVDSQATSGTEAGERIRRYKFGDAELSLVGTEEEFTDRFHDIYEECAIELSGRSLDNAHSCSIVPRGEGLIEVLFAGPELTHAQAIASKLVGDAGYKQLDCDLLEWGLFRSPTGQLLGVRSDVLVVERADRWQWIVANLAISRVLGSQPQSIFFHGASIGIGGKGVAIIGATGMGKTTLSLALAARGHNFLSDEAVGVQLATRDMIPFRRAPLVRPGPASNRVDAALGGPRQSREPRQCAPVGELFPRAVVADVKADVVICLRKFAAKTEFVSFRPGLDTLGYLNPLFCSMMLGSPAVRAMRVLNFLSQIDCYFLDSASPDSAADAIETLMEA